MANAAGNAKEFGEAEQLFDVAVKRDPKHEQARLLRAAAKYGQRDFEGAIKDIDAALAANTRAVERLQKSRSARDPRDRFDIARDDSGLAGLRTRRLSELATRCVARIELDQLELARSDAVAMRELAPDKSDGYVKLGFIDRKAGRFEGARQHFQAALDLEKEPRLRAMLTNALREIEQGDSKAGSTGSPENGAIRARNSTIPTSSCGKAILILERKQTAAQTRKESGRTLRSSRMRATS